MSKNFSQIQRPKEQKLVQKRLWKRLPWLYQILKILFAAYQPPFRFKVTLIKEFIDLHLKQRNCAITNFEDFFSYFYSCFVHYAHHRWLQFVISMLVHMNNCIKQNLWLHGLIDARFLLSKCKLYSMKYTYTNLKPFFRIYLFLILTNLRSKKRAL